ncbi:cytochrome P450 [Pterulicium gracile]|uniref:Cytochrome P450 n=1 Tax=Pterulicium gracile TaxID=1884261 RepID=A0A5C3QI00_9AGAR|nr:cytochrome P450 [Pterula gracilis]
MSEDEIYCQFSTMVLAGHDTTANTIPGRFTSAANAPKSSSGYALRSWLRVKSMGSSTTKLLWTRICWTLSLCSTLSSRLVRSLRGKLLVLILPGLQESCRLHPIFSTLAREAGQDDVIPLSFPVQTQSGVLVDSITARKGQSIGIFICAYNRIRAIWGEDAHEWNPDRWMKEGVRKDTVNIGLHANLLIFSAGVRGCIGCFALIELQVLLFQLISRFEFAPSPEKHDVMRAVDALMVPVIRGKIEMGVNMPLRVTPVQVDVSG